MVAVLGLVWLQFDFIDKSNEFDFVSFFCEHVLDLDPVWLQS